MSEPNYYTATFFTKNVLAIEIKKKTLILMNRAAYLRRSILELSKISMYKFWYHYVKPKYVENQNGYRQFHCIH